MLTGCDQTGESETSEQSNSQETQTMIDEAIQAFSSRNKELEPTLTGRYLQSQFAQTHYDWVAANEFLNDVIESDPKNPELMKRSMMLSIGTGNIQNAAARARAISEIESDYELGQIIDIVYAIARDDWQTAQNISEKMYDGDLSGFVKPLLEIWFTAKNGQVYEIQNLRNATHLFHSALAANYLNDKKQTEEFVNRILLSGALSNYDALRIARMLFAIGRNEDGLKIIKSLLEQAPSDQNLNEMVSAAEAKDEAMINEKIIAPILLDSPKDGIAQAMYDMGILLHNDFSDSSTKIFTQLALAIDPEMTKAHLLLASIYIRNKNFEEAIDRLSAIKEDDPAYIDAQRNRAELLAEIEKYDEAKAQLESLHSISGDLNALITIGDLYRQREMFKEAIKAYNRAEKAILEKTGLNEVPEKYWALLYARGMAYERAKNWEKAEADLVKALEYRPEHPYLLNYLGYSWADRDENLEKALEMIEKAVSLRPMDGYIADSLGWVQYRMGKYEDAIESLERSVELLPYDAVINDHLGDAYWKGGRYKEAVFQWERALNYSEDEALSEKIKLKIRYGLEDAQKMETDELPSDDEDVSVE